MYRLSKKGWFKCVSTDLICSFIMEHFTLLSLGVILISSDSSQSATLNATAYPSNRFTKDYILYNHNLTWSEAYNYCGKDDGELMSPTWSDAYVYVKNAGLKYGWPPSINIWIGIIKYEFGENWNNANSCENETGLNIQGEIPDTRQCALLNMSTENTGTSNIFAVPCDMEAGHVCSTNFQKLNDTTSVYTLYKNMSLASGSIDSKWNVPTLNDCIYVLFKECYFCYAAEFLHLENSCNLFLKSANILPDTVEIQTSFDYQTLVLKKTSRVFISNDTAASSDRVSFSEYPCLETTTSTYASMSTEEQTSPTVPGNCPCYCTSNFVNKTREEIVSGILTRRAELLLEPSTLSVHVRTKTCAADDRKSAGSIGYMGAVALTVVLAIPVLNDAAGVVMYIYKRTYK